MAFVRNGDVFVRDLRSGALTQLTRSDADEAQPQWSRDGALVLPRRQRLVSAGRAGAGVSAGGDRQGGEGSGTPRRRPTTCATASCA